MLPDAVGASVGHSRHFRGILGFQEVPAAPRHRGFLSPLWVRLGQSLAVRPWSGNRRHQGALVGLAPPEDPFDLQTPVHPGREGRSQSTLRRKGANDANVLATRLPDCVFVQTINN